MQSGATCSPRDSIIVILLLLFILFIVTTIFIVIFIIMFSQGLNHWLSSSSSSLSSPSPLSSLLSSLSPLPLSPSIYFPRDSIFDFNPHHHHKHFGHIHPVIFGQIDFIIFVPPAFSYLSRQHFVGLGNRENLPVQHTNHSKFSHADIVLFWENSWWLFWPLAPKQV